MNKPIQTINNRIKPESVDKQRGVGVVELLITLATLGTAVVAVATRYPKLPPGFDD